MNIPGELIPIVMFVMVGFTIVGYPIARALARSIERRAESSRIPDEVTARLERMESTLEAVAEQVERVTEGQRFTTKLLSERKSADGAVS
jgi:hypothetical protein